MPPIYRINYPSAAFIILQYEDPIQIRIIVTMDTAGSFPGTFAQCLKELSVSGSSSGSSVPSKWLSFRNPTQLFQLFMGDGQHVFSAHGRQDLPPF